MPLASVATAYSPARSAARQSLLPSLCISAPLCGRRTPSVRTYCRHKPYTAAPVILRLASVFALILTAACSGGGAPGSTFLSIATGGTGGVYYPYGGGLAKVLNDSIPGVRASAEVTAASVDNLKLIRDGKADVAFALADTVADAANARGAFEGAPVPVVSLAVLYSNYTHLVTRASSGITTVADLRGKTVSTGSPGSGTEVIAFRVIRAAGLKPDADITKQGLGASE